MVSSGKFLVSGNVFTVEWNGHVVLPRVIKDLQDFLRPTSCKHTIENKSKMDEINKGSRLHHHLIIRLKI